MKLKPKNQKHPQRKNIDKNSKNSRTCKIKNNNKIKHDNINQIKRINK